jgi:hypothetical protein
LTVKVSQKKFIGGTAGAEKERLLSGGGESWEVGNAATEWERGGTKHFRGGTKERVDCLRISEGREWVGKPEADSAVCPVLVRGSENADNVLDNLGSLGGTFGVRKVDLEILDENGALGIGGKVSAVF